MRKESQGGKWCGGAESDWRLAGVGKKVRLEESDMGGIWLHVHIFASKRIIRVIPIRASRAKKFSCFIGVISAIRVSMIMRVSRFIGVISAIRVL